MKKEIIETRLRNIIFGTLLIFGGGSRPSTISRIKREEFDKAEAILIDGEEIMKIHVWADKTSNCYGSATIAFMFPGLYTLTKKYLRVYKQSLKSDGYLLGNFMGNETKPRVALNYIKEHFLEDICTKEERDTLNPEDFRHAVAAWNTQGTSELYRSTIAPRFQHHSASVRDEHYVKQNEDEEVIKHLMGLLHLTNSKTKHEDSNLKVDAHKKFDVYKPVFEDDDISARKAHIRGRALNDEDRLYIHELFVEEESPNFKFSNPFTQDTIRNLRDNDKRFDAILTELEKMVAKNGQPKGERGAISTIRKSVDSKLKSLQTKPFT